MSNPLKRDMSHISRVMPVTSKDGRLWDLESIPCPLCGSSDLRVVGTKRGHFITEAFRIVACRDCGLIYINPRIAEGQIPALYDDAYYRVSFTDSHRNTAGFPSDSAHERAAGQRVDPDQKLGALPGGMHRGFAGAARGEPRNRRHRQLLDRWNARNCAEDREQRRHREPGTPFATQCRSQGRERRVSVSRRR